MPPVNVRNLTTGDVRSMSADEARDLLAAQPSTWAVESAQEAAADTRKAQVRSDYSGTLDKASVIASQGLSGITAGLSDVAAGALFPDSAIEEYRNQIDANRGLATASNVGGAIAGAAASGGTSLLAKSPAAAISRLGAAISRTAPEAGALAKVGRGFAGAATEGALQEAGAVAGDLALADDQSQVEHIIGSLPSRFLMAGGVSGAAGGGFAGLDHVLSSAGKRLRAAKDAATAATDVTAIPDDLAALDRAGLRTAKDAELAAIEQARVPERAILADEINAFREQTKIDQPWVSVAQGSSKDTKYAAKKAAKRTAKVAGDADRLAAAAEAEAVAAEAAVATGAGVVGRDPLKGLPAYERLGDRVYARTVPARDLAGRVRALPGAGDDTVKLDKARAAMKEGQRDPVKLVVRGDGTLEAVDGRHRLLAAMEADLPVKIQVERGVASVADDGTVALGDAYARRVGSEEAAKARATAVAAREAADKAAADAADATARLEAVTTKYPRWFDEQGKLYMEADKHIDRVLRNPKKLAGTTIGDATQQARDAGASLGSIRAGLQEQESALELILSRKDELATFHALDKTGRRAAALARVPAALEANRALQQKLASLTSSPASSRLAAIQAAEDALGASKMTLKQKLGGALAFGAVTAAASGVDVPGMGYIAPILGAAAGSAVAGKLGGAVAKTTAAARERMARTAEMFATGARLARRAVAPVASRVLAEVRFAPDEAGRDREAPPATLAGNFKARSQEMARIVVTGPDGKPAVRPETRRQIADRLAPIAQTAPHLADRAESEAVKRILFLDAKRPRTVRIGMTEIEPGELAMRAWARYVAAAEGPDGIEERLLDGSITPEDAETMRELYPERMAELTRMIVEKMATLRAKLPTQRRLSLSLFTGAPVDAVMEPRILAQLQNAYKNEPGTEGGSQAPRPRPAFGSVKKPDPTPAQQRAI